MRSALRLMPLLVLTAVVGYKLGSSGESPAGATAQAATPQVNACGCYRDSAGSCYCGKKAGKCACPGECEPQGCEEKRVKEMDKEVAAEAKRARDAEKKQEDEQAEKDRKAALPPPGEDDEGDSGNDKAESSDKKPGSGSPSARKDDDEDDDSRANAKKKGAKGKAKGAKNKHDKNDQNDKAGGLEG